MAQADGSFNEEQLSCSVCLDVLKDPVTIPCGHSYCMNCIKTCLDLDDDTGVYSCPQCRESFTTRPILRKNTILAGMAEELKSRLKAAPPAHCYAGPEDVACDVCTGRKRKAVKSCLVCLASYCEAHLKIHGDLNPGNLHDVVDATTRLQENICPRHKKLREVYCRTDRRFICYLCGMDEHKSHDTVSAATERTEKQEQLGATQSKFQRRIQEREKELQDLRQAVSSLKLSAQAAVEDSERIFTELIRSIERRRSEVRELIRDQEEAEVSWIEGLLERLEQEIAELRRRDTELEQLSHTEDHIHFLQRFQSLCDSPGPGDLPRVTVSANVSFETMRKSVSKLNTRLEDVCEEELVEIAESVKEVHIAFSANSGSEKPETSEEEQGKACIPMLGGSYGNTSAGKDFNSWDLSTNATLPPPYYPSSGDGTSGVPGAPKPLSYVPYRDDGTPETFEPPKPLSYVPFRDDGTPETFEPPKPLSYVPFRDDGTPETFEPPKPLSYVPYRGNGTPETFEPPKPLSYVPFRDDGTPETFEPPKPLSYVPFRDDGTPETFEPPKPLSYVPYRGNGTPETFEPPKPLSYVPYRGNGTPGKFESPKPLLYVPCDGYKTSEKFEPPKPLSYVPYRSDGAPEKFEPPKPFSYVPYGGYGTPERFEPPKPFSYNPYGGYGTPARFEPPKPFSYDPYGGYGTPARFEPPKPFSYDPYGTDGPSEKP